MGFMTQFDKNSFFRMGQNHGLTCKPPISQASTYRAGYEAGLYECHLRLFAGVPKVSKSDLRYLRDAPFPRRQTRSSGYEYRRYGQPVPQNSDLRDAMNDLRHAMNTSLHSDTLTGVLNALNSTPSPVVGDEIPAITMRWVEDAMNVLAEHTVTPEVNLEVHQVNPYCADCPICIGLGNTDSH